jgi:hypothetical protein
MTVNSSFLRVARAAATLEDKLLNFISTSSLYKIVKWAQSSDDPDQDGRTLVAGVEDADVVASSYNAHGFNTSMHRPVLDIDLDAVLVPSSTPGHHHLYIDKLMSWETYTELLQALAKAGIVQQGFVDVSLKRGASMVRLPWVKK